MANVIFHQIFSAAFVVIHQISLVPCFFATCDRLLMLSGTITGPIVVQQ